MYVFLRLDLLRFNLHTLGFTYFSVQFHEVLPIATLSATVFILMDRILKLEWQGRHF